jgi:hypothetical protein
MQDVFAISVKAINEDNEEVGLQAIEFWSTLCDYELDLLEEGPGSEEVGGWVGRQGLPIPMVGRGEVILGMTPRRSPGPSSHHSLIGMLHL